MFGTWHILKQVEWYHKLKEEYGCFFVEMEYKKNLRFYKQKYNSIICDVFGKREDGRIFIVEIGDIPKWKLKYLQKMALTKRRVTFFYEPKPFEKVEFT